MAAIRQGPANPAATHDATREQFPPHSLFDHATRAFDQTDLACFASGTRIKTAGNGPQPVRRVPSKPVLATGARAPVRIPAKVPGNALPVPPHHGILVSRWQAELPTGEPEVLTAAADPTAGNDRICRRPIPQVNYVHLLFDCHEIIVAKGAVTESHHPLSSNEKDRAPDTIAELRALFPDLGTASAHTRAARPCIAAHKTALLRR